MPVHSRTATVGQPAPEIALTDQHGAPFRLSEAATPTVLVFLRGFA